MSKTQFNREKMARWYAMQHLKTDPGIREVYFLPANAPDREIRLLEVNTLIAVRESDPVEPIDFGVDSGSATAHSLLVLDVTPGQFDRIRKREIALPTGWTLDKAVPFTRAA